MPSDDLSSIPDLQDKHRRVLARELKVTTFRRSGPGRPARHPAGDAKPAAAPDPRADRAVARPRPEQPEPGINGPVRPAPGRVIRGRLRGNVKAGDGRQRRIEVERTEVEPEEESRIWPGWDCEGIGRWMREQVPGGAQAEPEAARPAEPASTPAEAARERPELRIDRVTVIGLAASPGVVAADAPAATPLARRARRG